MVIFDQLRISDDGKELYINAHVNTAEGFANRYIKSVSVVTAENVSENNPWNLSSSAPVVFKEEYEEPVKEINLVVNCYNTSDDFAKGTFSGDLLFVYVQMVGATDECVPCYMSTDYTVGVTFDERLLYQRVMDYTKGLAKDCSIPSGFIDFILLWNAFKASVETGHYVSAIDFYNLLFGKGAKNSPYMKSNTVHTKSCGCHG